MQEQDARKCCKLGDDVVVGSCCHEQICAKDNILSGHTLAQLNGDYSWIGVVIVSRCQLASAKDGRTQFRFGTNEDNRLVLDEVVYWPRV